MTKQDKKDLINILKTITETKITKRLLKKLEKEFKPISVRSRKNKGSTFQKEVRNKISEIIELPWGTDDEALIASRQMGQQGVDIVLREEATKRFPFACEVKNQEALSWWEAIKQAKMNKGNFKYWILFVKKNKETPVVLLDMNDFFELYKDLLDNKKE